MQKGYSQRNLHTRRKSEDIHLPRIGSLLHRKHSIQDRDVEVPEMLQGLKSRLHRLNNESPTEEQRIRKEPSKYLKIYTKDKVCLLISSYMPLWRDFNEHLQIIKRKLYSRLPSYLYNLEMIQLLKSEYDESAILKMLDSVQKARDFHIIVDCLEKFLMEQRRKELKSRQKRLKGYNRHWEVGLQEQIDKIQRYCGKMNNVGSFTRKVSRLLDESIFALKLASHAQKEDEDSQQA